MEEECALVDPLTFLPEELALHMLTFLNPKELSTVSLVSSNWKRLSGMFRLSSVESG